jgi:hypothetical protein
VVASLFVVALAPTGDAQKGNPKSCERMDGLFDRDGWDDGVVAPGIHVTSFTQEEVTFDVAAGATLVDLCASSQKDKNVYNIDSELPAEGPITITLRQASKDRKFREVSFDVEAGDPDPEPTPSEEPTPDPTPDPTPSPTEPPEVTCPTVDAPNVEFAPPMYIDRDRAGGEPVSVVAGDGSISVSAHAGTTHIYKNPTAAPGAGDFAIGYWNQTLNWRSDDGGDSWEYVGIAGQNQGPHSATSTGFSDPDFAMDQAGNIYNVEIDLANVSVFKSNDDGQSYLQANPEAWFGDRPWVTGLEADEVFLYTNLPRFMLKSVDGGITWAPVTNTPGGTNGVTNNQSPAHPPIGGKSIPDPLNPNNGLIAPVGGQDSVGRFAIGVENDADVDNPVAPHINWTLHNFGPMGRAEQFFGVVAADSVGNVYQAGAGGYGGANDVTPNGEVSFGYFDRSTGTANPEKINIPTPQGDALWPWAIAGDEDRAAVVWYQNLAGEPTKFYPYIAVTHNATGTTVTCSDGSTKHLPPRFTVLNASQRPVFVGNICLAGTNCNANTNFQAGDRRLGDFFTVNFDHEGNLFIVTADTMIPNPVNGQQKPVGNPIFIKQIEGGDLMLEEPRAIRPTRCLMNLPAC